MLIKPFFTEFSFTLPLRQVFYFSLIVGLYTIIPVSLHVSEVFTNVEKLSTGLEAILGLVLSLLLVFRANRAYERWWEARTNWGILVNVSRNLAIKVKSMVDPDAHDAQYFHYLISEFCLSLLHHLRNSDYRTQAPLGKKVPKNIGNIPIYFCELIYQKLEEYKNQKIINDTQFLTIDTDLSRFMHVTGACEKIKNTLISLSYRAFVHHIMIILFIFLPWKFADSYELWCIPLMVIISYITFALEGIARHMEEPFGDSIDDVHMTQICKTIDKSVRQILSVYE